MLRVLGGAVLTSPRRKKRSVGSPAFFFSFLDAIEKSRQASSVARSPLCVAEAHGTVLLLFLCTKVRSTTSFRDIRRGLGFLPLTRSPRLLPYPTSALVHITSTLAPLLVFPLALPVDLSFRRPPHLRTSPRPPHSNASGPYASHTTSCCSIRQPNRRPMSSA